MFFIIYLLLLRDNRYFEPPQRNSYPKNCAPDGPISTSLLTSPSPSTIGGGYARRWRFARRQVIRVGAGHFLGGMIIRIPS